MSHNFGILAQTKIFMLRLARVQASWRVARCFASSNQIAVTSTRIKPTPAQQTADEAFLQWCQSKGVLAPRIELGHCMLGGVPQRGLFATADAAAGEPLVAVPHDAFFGRASHPNKQLITLTDRLFPRGSPPLRPLTPEEMMKETDPTMTHFAPNLQLAVFLTMEVAAGSASPYRPWLDVLPALPVALSNEVRPMKAQDTPSQTMMNAPFLDVESAKQILQHAIQSGRTSLAAGDLKALVSDMSERLDAYHEFLAEVMASNNILRTMIERVAKARFNGDVDDAITLFRWALAVADSRGTDGVNNIDRDSPLMELDPYLHLDVSGDGKQQVNKAAAAQSARFSARERDLAGKSMAEQNAGEAKLRNALGDIPHVASIAEASSRLPDLSELPVSITPVIVPLLDMVNHADGNAPTNVVIQTGGMPPFSATERRNHMRTLRRLGLSDELAEELNRNDKKLSRYIILRATEAIKKGDQLFSCYAPQIDMSDDAFLFTYGFIPQPLSEERRLEQLRRLKNEADEREAKQMYYARLQGLQNQHESEREANTAPLGIFAHADQVGNIPHSAPQSTATAAASVAKPRVVTPAPSNDLGIDDALLSKLGLDDLVKNSASETSAAPAAGAAGAAGAADAPKSPEEIEQEQISARLVESNIARRAREARERIALQRDLQRVKDIDSEQQSDGKWFERAIPSVLPADIQITQTSTPSAAISSEDVKADESKDSWYDRPIPRSW